MIIANNRKDDEFLRAVKGIAFLGVPHHGSGVVELGKYVAYLLRSLSRKINSDLLADLNTRSRVLNSICVDATHLICQLRIITFYETRKFPGLGRLVSPCPPTVSIFTVYSVFACFSLFARLPFPPPIPSVSRAASHKSTRLIETPRSSTRTPLA